MSPREMLERINQKWATEKKWSKQEFDQSNNLTTSFWKFTDEKNHAWNGIANVKAAGESGKLLVKLKIARQQQADMRSN